MKTTPTKEDLERLYFREHLCQKDIGKIFNRKANTVNQWFKKYQIKIDNRFRRKQHIIRDDFFDYWSSDMAYILGFIICDGWVQKNTIAIELNRNDNEVVEYIASKICPEQPIKHRDRLDKRTNNTYKMCSLHFGSDRITSKLKEFGITPNKTRKEICPKDIPKEFVPDFIRGIIDGDGSIITKNIITDGKPYKAFCIQIASACERFLLDLKDQYLFNLGKVIKKPTCYVWELRSRKEIVFLLNYIYNGNFYLKRKYEKYLEVLDYENRMENNPISQGTIEGWNRYKKDNNINYSEEHL